MISLKQLRKRTTEWYCGKHVAYHHLPKCGGTSVVHALRWNYLPSYATFPTNAVYRAIEVLNPGYDDNLTMKQVVDFREKHLLALMFSDVRCIAGHVRVSQVALDTFREHYNFVTTLRDPITLLISLYFYDKRHPLPRWRTDDKIEAYLETERAKMFGAIYADFYSGLPLESDMQSQDAIDRAKRNLESFAVIGMLDDMDRFQRRLGDVLGVRVRIGHLNKAGVSSDDLHNVVTADVRKRFRR